MIELNLLVKKTIDYLISNGLKELKKHESPRNPKSCFGLICYDCIGKYEFKQASYIKSSWEKDSKKFRTKVLEGLNLNSEQNGLVSRFEVDVFTTKEIEKNILSQSRPYIRKSFIAAIVTRKLQEYGLNCSFTCPSNYFSLKKKKYSFWNVFK